MKLRKALKIWRAVDNPFYPNGTFRELDWKKKTIRAAYLRVLKAGNRFDERAPYMKSGDELNEDADMMFCIFADILIDNEDERDAVKEKYFMETSK